MNEKVRAHLKKWAEDHDWPSTTDEHLADVARHAGKRVHREEFDRHRWWTEYLCIRDIGGILIGHYSALTDGDMSADERGYDFDPAALFEYRAVQVTVTKYEPVEN